MSDQCRKLDVRVQKLAPMRVARFHATGLHPESDAWAKVQRWAESRRLLKDAAAHPLFGFNNPSPTRTGEPYGYEFWIRIEPECPVEKGIETQNFTGGWYAVATHCGLPNPDVWMQLFEWVRNSPYHYRRTHELERPHNPLATESEMIVDLYLPVDEPVAAGNVHAT